MKTLVSFTFFSLLVGRPSQWFAEEGEVDDQQGGWEEGRKQASKHCDLHSPVSVLTILFMDSEGQKGTQDSSDEHSWVDTRY